MPVYFIILVFSKKKKNFREKEKPFLGAKLFLNGKGASGDENRYNFFIMGNKVLNMFSYKFFQRNRYFPKKLRKKILEGYDHFSGDGVILVQKRI